MIIYKVSKATRIRKALVSGGDIKKLGFYVPPFSASPIIRVDDAYAEYHVHLSGDEIRKLYDMLGRMGP